MRRAAIVLAVLVAVATLLWVAFRPGARIELRGGDGASIPVASPAEQGLEPAALDAAAATARAAGAAALLVSRRGHLVFEYTTRTTDGRLRSTLSARLLQVAAAGRDVAPASAADVSAAVWQPLAAASAFYEPGAGGAPRLDCCLWARPRDVLALATAVLSGGEVGGQHLLTPAAAARVLDTLDDGIAPRGAEAFGSTPVRLLRDGDGTRLYFFPSQQIAILLVGADEKRFADETALAHQVLRGIVDRPAPQQPSPALHDLVPAH